MKRAVVTGIGIISALGIGRETNWAKMRSGKSGISEIASFDAAGYRGVSGGEAREFAGTTIRKARKARLDRASHLLIHAAREAMVHANISETIGKERVFVSVGTTLGGMLSGEVFHREFLKKGPARTRISILSDYLAHSQAISLFRELELRGDFVIFSDACASGTNAVGNGFRAIRQGRYTTAICGGYDTMSEYTFAGFNSLMAVTPTLCRPFDKERNGLVLGEGAGVLILEELEHALERRAEILCEIIGYGASSDAHHITAPDPSGRSAARAMQEALVEAGSPRVDHINAHGTCTKYNDPM